jgi:hypothetical protein
LSKNHRGIGERRSSQDATMVESKRLKKKCCQRERKSLFIGVPKICPLA